MLLLQMTKRFLQQYNTVSQGVACLAKNELRQLQSLLDKSFARIHRVLPLAGLLIFECLALLSFDDNCDTEDADAQQWDRPEAENGHDRRED